MRYVSSVSGIIYIISNFATVASNNDMYITSPPPASTTDYSIAKLQHLYLHAQRSSVFVIKRWSFLLRVVQTQLQQQLFSKHGQVLHGDVLHFKTLRCAESGVIFT